MKFRRSGEAGFTLIETLTAVAVISIAGLSLLWGFSSALRAVQEARANSAFAVKLLFADEVLRSRIGAVAVPYWERAAMASGSSVETDSGITLPWFRGNRESTVSVSAIEGELLLETVHAGESERFVLLEGAEAEDISLALIPDDGLALGVDIRFSRRGREYRIAAGFGSRPLGPSGSGI